MIKPTIGRVVLVHREHVKGGDPDAQPEPALICFVHNDRCINVGGFDKLGRPFQHTSLDLLQDDDKPTTGYWAEWMPYQKEQAAKADQPA